MVAAFRAKDGAETPACSRQEKSLHITRSYLEVPCVHKSESEAFATIRGTHGTWWSGAASAAEPEERATGRATQQIA